MNTAHLVEIATSTGTTVFACTVIERSVERGVRFVRVQLVTGDVICVFPSQPLPDQSSPTGETKCAPTSPSKSAT